MHRLTALLSFTAAACSSSVAQDIPHPAPVTEVATPVIVEEPVLTSTIVDVDAKVLPTVTIPKADRTRRNAVLLARVAVNENTRPLRSIVDGGTAGEPTSDARALIQEMVAFAEWKGVNLKRAITWQSRYVSGEKEAKKGSQHAWTSTLPSRGKDMPEGWIECEGLDPESGRATPQGCDGKWELYADNWVAFRTWMINQIQSGEVVAECDGTPITWGGDGLDDHIAISRGLCVIEGCGDLNSFWAFPGQGCDEAMRDILARRRQNQRPRRSVKTVSAREIMRAMRRQDDPS